MGHRGKQSSDDAIFAPRYAAAFKEAAHDLAFLLERGYGDKSSLQLVGNRYLLNARQQMALSRIVVAPSVAASRQQKMVAPEALAGKTLCIDGYNVLIGLEVALSQGFLFATMDGCYRDIASIHGTYRRVEETLPALELIGKILHQALGATHLHWFFDAPVSNSGRLKVLMYELIEPLGYQWTIDLVNNPDKAVAEQPHIVASSDGWVLDNSTQVFNLLRFIVDNAIKDAEILNFL